MRDDGVRRVVVLLGGEDFEVISGAAGRAGERVSAYIREAALNRATGTTWSIKTEHNAVDIRVRVSDAG